MTTLIEADVERAARDWLEGLDWQVAHKPGTLPRCADPRARLRDALQPELVVGRSRTDVVQTGEKD